MNGAPSLPERRPRATATVRQRRAPPRRITGSNVTVVVEAPASHESHEAHLNAILEEDFAGRPVPSRSVGWECTLCGEHFDLEGYTQHMMVEHANLLLTYQSLILPTPAARNSPLSYLEFLSHLGPLMDAIGGGDEDDFGLGLLQNEANYADVDNATYEQLLAMCETVGEAERPLPLVEDVTVPYAANEAEANANANANEPEANERCPICMEDCVRRGSEGDPVEVCRIKRCGHVYCRPCIREWFLQKPTCPLCGQDSRDTLKA